MTKKSETETKDDAGIDRHELEEAIKSGCELLPVHYELYKKLKDWKYQLYPCGCSWTTFFQHLLNERERVHLETAGTRLEQLRRLQQEEHELERTPGYKAGRHYDGIKNWPKGQVAE